MALHHSTLRKLSSNAMFLALTQKVWSMLRMNLIAISTMISKTCRAKNTRILHLIHPLQTYMLNSSQMQTSPQEKRE